MLPQKIKSNIRYLHLLVSTHDFNNTKETINLQLPAMCDLMLGIVFHPNVLQANQG